MRRAVRGFIAFGSIAALTVVGAGVITLRAVGVASLARDSGTVVLEGLGAPVSVSRDDKAIPVIQGESYSDVCRAIGFVHAQERFFQMDMMRRASSGELAALLGAALVERDIEMRARGLGRAARDSFESLPAEHQRWLEAYAAGVNAGLDDLKAWPPEYLLLRAAPTEWRPSDTMLIVSTMALILSDSSSLERVVEGLEAAMPDEVVSFLTQPYSRLDAPLEGGDEYTPLDVPGPDLIDLRTGRATKGTRISAADRDETVMGSNTFAVSGSMTTDGRAILASDPHLGLTAPGIWFRAQLQWGDGADARRVAGVTIPGTPLVVVGSNGNIAWGPTNVHGDFTDHIVIETDPDDPSRYRVPGGWESFGSRIETIEVRAGETRRIELRETRWGAIRGEDSLGRPLVLKWTGSDPSMINLRLLDIAEARTLDQAIEVLGSWWGPPQNIAAADDTGRVALVTSGWLPNRKGIDGRTPASWARQGAGWDGQLDESQRPVFQDPQSGFVYAANARIVAEPVASLIGHAWPIGTRAGRIVELLTDATGLQESDLLNYQLDTDIEPAMEPWRRLVLDSIPESEADQDLRAARESILQWNGTADVDQRGVTILEAFRDAVRADLYASINTIVRERVDGFRYRWTGSDEWTFRVLDERPAHWLQPGFESWEEYARAALVRVLDRMSTGGDRWGKVNTAIVRHPVSLAVPALGAGLDMPESPVPGHWAALRVHRSSFGASMRMVVSPGREQDGILHMPAGQSGHPLSRHYGDMHEDWIRGRPTPLLAGPAVSSFELRPAD